MPLLPDVPLHAQVAARLRTAIDEGVMSGALPSESDLTKHFSVSRSVVRQALGTLENEGLISKIRGKGSFVAPRERVHRVVQSLNGLGMQLSDLGQPHRTAVLSYHVGPDDAIPAEWRTDEALHLQRLRSSINGPVALIRTMLPAWVASVITKDELEDQSLHRLLRDRAGITLERSQRTVLALPATEAIATHLRCATGAPLLVLEGETFDTEGRIVEVFSTFHRGDSVAFDVETVV